MRRSLLALLLVCGVTLTGCDEKKPSTGNDKVDKGGAAAPPPPPPPPPPK